MVDFFNSYSSNSFGISALFQPLYRISGIGNDAILQRSGATLFAYSGADFSERLAVRNLNDATFRARLENGTSLSNVGASVTTASGSTDALIRDLQAQIDELRRQIASSATGEIPSYSIYKSTGADNAINDRYHNVNVSNYAIEIAPQNSVAQETPKDGSTPNYDNFLVFNVSRTGYTAGASSVDYDFITHLSTSTIDDFSLYAPSSSTQFRNPKRDTLNGFTPSGTVYFAAGETSKNITISIRNDQVLENQDETLTLGLYKPSTYNLLDTATGLIAADKNRSIGTVSAQINYNDVGGLMETYATDSSQDYLRLSRIDNASLGSFFTGQIEENERVRISLDIEYGDIDPNDYSAFDANAMTTTFSQDFFLSANPNALARDLDPNGNILESGPLVFTDVAALNGYISALTPNDVYGLMITVSAAEYVDELGMDIGMNTISPNFFIMDSVNLVIGGPASYNIETPAATTWDEGKSYEIVVRRDLADQAEDVELTLAEITANPALQSVFEPNDIAGGTIHSLMFAAGDFTQTLTLAVTNDGVDENEEPFSANLTAFSGMGVAGAVDRIDLSIDGPLTSTPPTPPPTSANEFSITPVMLTYPADVNEGDTLTFNIDRTTGVAATSLNVALIPRTVINRSAIDFDDIDPDITAYITDVNGNTRLVTPALVPDSGGGSANLTFDGDLTAGDVSARIEISVNNDTNKEASELFSVVFTTAGGTINGNASFDGTILASDDDGMTNYTIIENPNFVNGSAVLLEGNDPTTSIKEYIITRDFDTAQENVSLTFTGAGGNPADLSDIEITLQDGTQTPMQVNLAGNTATITLNANESSKTIRVTTVDDTAQEQDEDFTLEFTDPNNVTTAFNSTIQANDIPVMYAVDSADKNYMGVYAFNENSPTALEIEFMRDTTLGASTTYIEVGDNRTMNNTQPVTNDDYTFDPSLNPSIMELPIGLTWDAMPLSANLADRLRYFEITFADGVDTITGTFNLIDDNIDETNQELSFAIGVDNPNPPTFGVVLTDNDAGNTIFSISETMPATVALEGGAPYQFEIMRSGTAGDTVQFSLADAAGTGVFGAADIDMLSVTAGGMLTMLSPLDYELTFDPTSNTASFELSFVDTDNDRGDETFNINLTSPAAGNMLFLDGNNNSINNVVLMDFVLNDLRIVTVPNTYREGNNPATSEVVFTVENQTGADGTVELDIQGAANMGIDANDISAYTVDGGNSIAFGALAPITLTFSAGQLAQNVTLTLADDALIEGDEGLELTLQNATGNLSLGATPSMRSITVQDNDSEFDFQIYERGTMNTPATYDEGMAYDLVVMRTSGNGAFDIDPNLIGLSGTDFDNKDFRFFTSSLSFGDNTTELTAVFEILNDNVIETESFNINAQVTPQSGGFATLSFPQNPFGVTDGGGNPGGGTGGGGTGGGGTGGGGTGGGGTGGGGTGGGTNPIATTFSITADAMGTTSITESDTYDFTITRDVNTEDTDAIISFTGITFDDLESLSITGAEFTTASGNFSSLTMQQIDAIGTTDFSIRFAQGGATSAMIAASFNVYDGLENPIESFDIDLSALDASDAVDPNANELSKSVNGNTAIALNENPNEAFFKLEIRDPATGNLVSALREGESYDLVVSRGGFTTDQGSVDFVFVSAPAGSLDANDFLMATFNSMDVSSTLLTSFEILFVIGDAAAKTVQIELADDDNADELWSISLQTGSDLFNTTVNYDTTPAGFFTVDMN